MNLTIRLAACAPLLLAACDELPGQTGAPSDNFINPLPENVASLAAPGQNLKAVKIASDSGCFVYRYAGPVETTFLPLRTRQGNPICTEQPAEAEEVAEG